MPRYLLTLGGVCALSFAGAALFSVNAASHGQPADDFVYETRAELEAAILAGDAALFDQGFNLCNLEALEATLGDDVTMVHDQAGRTEGLASFLEPVRANICNGGSAKPLRYLDPGTTEIYPLYESGRLYGALQYGLHSFYIREGEAEPYLTNRARFMTEWSLTETGWQVKTAYSWDHLNPSENHPIDSDVLESGFDRQQLINALLDAHNVQAQSIAIIRGGQLAEVRNFGLQDGATPISMDTLYNAASLAKPITALTTLKLADAGLIDLDEPLARYDLDPEIADAPEAQRVTARHVLSHSSGLPNWRYLMEDNQLRFQFEPGEGYDYSGEGFEWLRRALEAKLGRSLEDLAREHVFEPAGMRSTSYLYPGPRDEPRLAARYDENLDLIETRPHSEANAAANLITTAEDYGRFAAWVSRGADLSPELAADMVTAQIEQNDSFDFGLGWQMTRTIPFALQHSGSDPGVRSLAIIWPETGDGIVLLSNSNGALQTWQLIITDQFGERGWDILRANGRE